VVAPAAAPAIQSGFAAIQLLISVQSAGSIGRGTYRAPDQCISTATIFDTPRRSIVTP
jgi:hypothetical protein